MCFQGVSRASCCPERRTTEPWPGDKGSSPAFLNKKLSLDLSISQTPPGSCGSHDPCAPLLQPRGDHGSGFSHSRHQLACLMCHSHCWLGWETGHLPATVPIGVWPLCRP